MLSVTNRLCTTTVPPVLLTATNETFSNKPLLTLLLMVTVSIVGAQPVLGYDCFEQTIGGPLTLGSSESPHTIDGCTMEKTVYLQDGSQVTIKNTQFTFVGGVQLSVDGKVILTVLGSTFGNTGTPASPSIDITNFDATHLIVAQNIFLGYGLIKLSTTKMSSTSSFTASGNILGGATRGGASASNYFIDSAGIVLNNDGHFNITDNDATPAAAPKFESDGGLGILRVTGFLESKNTKPAFLRINNNKGFEEIMLAEKGGLDVASVGALEIRHNTQRIVNGINTKASVIKLFTLSGVFIPVGFTISVEYNSFEATMPLYSSTAASGSSIWIFYILTKDGYRGNLLIRHNTIVAEHYDTIDFAPITLALNDGGSGNFKPMSGTIDISDNTVTLTTSLQVTFVAIPALYAYGGKVLVDRNEVQYFGQTRNTLLNVEYWGMTELSRVSVTYNTIKGGAASNGDSYLLYQKNDGHTPVASSGTILDISHNRIRCNKQLLYMTTVSLYARILISYNVATFINYDSLSSPTGMTVNSAYLCLNRFDGTYRDPTSFSTFTGGGTLEDCPKRTPSRSQSYTVSSSVQMTPSLSHNLTITNYSPVPSSTTNGNSVITTTTSSNTYRGEGPNTTIDVTIIVPKGVPDEVFIASVTVGSITTPLALLETASSIQMAAIFTVMPCRTMDGSRTIMSHVLSPLQLSGTNASDLLGSFVLLSSISAVYFAVAMLVLRLARRLGDQEGDAPDMRVFKAKLFLWYPRVPMTVAVLLLPGMSFESCSLLYGVKNGGPWWERVIGAVGLLVSLAIVAYHIAVGIVVGRSARKQSQHDDDVFSSYNANTEIPEGRHDEANFDCAPASPKATKVFDFNEQSDAEQSEYDDEPQADGCEIPDREATDTTPVTPQEELAPSKPDADVPVSDNTPASNEETGATSLDGPQSNVYFVTYTEEAKARVPAVLAAMLLANGRWNKHVLRSMWFAVVNCRRDVVSYVCAHNCVRILLVSIVAAVDGKNLLECRIVQGIIAAICFLHALVILVGRVYRVPILTPLQAGQSVCVGLLACASFIQNADAQQAFVIVMMIVSLLTTILCAVVALIEVRVNQKVSAPADLDDSKAAE